MQTRIGSMVESIVNILLGFWVAILSQIIIFPMFGMVVTFADNLAIGAWFTAVSLVRSYCVRRWFNRHLFKITRNA